MAELGFKAKQPDWEPFHPEMSLLNHESPLVSILGKWKTQFHEKKNPRYRHHHHHSRQGTVPWCAGHCTECREDKETSSPATCLDQPDLWPLCPQCLHFREAVCAHLTPPPNNGSPPIAIVLFASALPFSYYFLSRIVVIYIHCHTAEPLHVTKPSAWLTPTHSLRFCSGLLTLLDSPVWIRYFSSVCPPYLLFIIIVDKCLLVCIPTYLDPTSQYQGIGLIFIWIFSTLHNTATNETLAKLFFFERMNEWIFHMSLIVLRGQNWISDSRLYLPRCPAHGRCSMNVAMTKWLQNTKRCKTPLSGI